MNKESGFSQVVLAITIAAMIIGSGAIFYRQKSIKRNNVPPKQSVQSSPKSNLLASPQAIKSPASQKSPIPESKKISTSQSILNQLFSRGQCQKSEINSFSASPMRVQEVALFVPLGLMVGGHVTPVDHQYFYPVGWKTGGADVTIFAPADGFIVKVNRYTSARNIEGLESKDGYDIIIEHSCNFYSKLGLLTGINIEIAKQLGTIERGREKNVRIPVKAGQEIAMVGGQSLDFFTFDLNTPPKQWIVPAHYNDSEGLKKYITDSILYFTEPLKSQLLSKNPRTIEPRGGRFDYDVDGRLIGTWFLKGTNGYTANNPSVQGYWRGHLVFAYNEIDPSSIEISMGSWGGDTRGYQFAVKNNGPDPRNISVADGTIKYELTEASFVKSDGEIWNQETYAGPVYRVLGRNVSGVVLVQMIDVRLIKVEKFAGKSLDQVNGFTSATEIYER